MEVHKVIIKILNLLSLLSHPPLKIYSIGYSYIDTYQVMYSLHWNDVYHWCDYGLGWKYVTCFWFMKLDISTKDEHMGKHRIYNHRISLCVLLQMYV